MDILPIAFLIVSTATLFWLVSRVFTQTKSNKEKDSLSLTWSKAALAIAGLLVALSIGNFRSNYGFSTLNALIWLALIAPVVAVVYFFYHILVLVKKPQLSATKNAKLQVAKERQKSKLYIAIFLSIIALSVFYPLARHWRDEQNAANLRKGNPYDCSVPTDFNNDYCTRLKNNHRLRELQG